VPNDGDLSTLGAVHPDRGEGPRLLRRHRLVYRLTSLALAAFAVLALLDLRHPIFGVTDTGPDGVHLEVVYPKLTRPALAAEFSIEVTRPGDFTEPVQLAVDRRWLEVWDENGLTPAPDSETSDGDWVVYEYEAPDTNTLRVFYDARIEPGRQSGIDGAVELRSETQVLASVSFHTAVRP
jgi:hypothetical protein